MLPYFTEDGSFIDFYQSLGILRNVTKEGIEKAYKREARSCHPDTHPGDSEAEKRFKEITRAKEFLLSGQKNSYDLLFPGAGVEIEFPSPQSEHDGNFGYTPDALALVPFADVEGINEHNEDVFGHSGAWDNIPTNEITIPALDLEVIEALVEANMGNVGKWDVYDAPENITGDSSAEPMVLIERTRGGEIFVQYLRGARSPEYISSLQNIALDLAKRQSLKQKDIAAISTESEQYRKQEYVSQVSILDLPDMILQRGEGEVRFTAYQDSEGQYPPIGY